MKDNEFNFVLHCSNRLFILSVNSNSYEKITKLKVEIDDFVMELNDVNAFDIQDNLIKLKQRITLLDNLPFNDR